MRSKRAERLYHTMLQKFGSDEAIKKWYKERGSRGGRAKVPKGFARVGREQHLEASRRGGQADRKKDEVEQ